MKIRIFEPKDIRLKKYIEYFYETELEDESYFAFPHFNLPVSYVDNSIVKIIDNEVFIENMENLNNSFFTVNKFVLPIKINIIGKVNDFCIVFKPYGLVQFLENTLDWKSSRDIFLINFFNNFNFPLLGINSDEKVTYISNFLLEKLIEKQGTDIVIKAIELMDKNELSIDLIAKQCNCSPKKLYRLFKSLCGESPITFKKIIKFRKSLEKIKKVNPEFNLTEVALDSNYYDQANFNNAFKKLTGETPKHFFKKTQSISQKNIYFKIIKKS
ncbi:helix-turn-helix transcriptional regulator [Flavobacterium jejuense]|uniref:Helix-turn-helix transcriptional regulator n=1 Tax=Flavobacterium jejuense TaxID=1544455 RepID=A0ABX0ISH3_9FLAO|nr:AraC family transcriptional regulator [Flavobacterium jejuense]NHN25061.1 helix-turn-helix transcriptional regulator [Flavobacterium jejuense]